MHPLHTHNVHPLHTHNVHPLYTHNVHPLHTHNVHPLAGAVPCAGPKEMFDRCPTKLEEAASPTPGKRSAAWGHSGRRETQRLEDARSTQCAVMVALPYVLPNSRIARFALPCVFEARSTSPRMTANPRLRRYRALVWG